MSTFEADLSHGLSEQAYLMWSRDGEGVTAVEREMIALGERLLRRRGKDPRLFAIRVWWGTCRPYVSVSRRDVVSVLGDLA